MTASMEANDLEELATSTKVAEAVAQELSRSNVAETGLPQLDRVLALRALWVFIVLAWISRKCDAFLVVLVVAMFGSVAALPVAEDIVEATEIVLPGVAFEMDLNNLLSSLQTSHREHALVAAAGGTTLLAMGLGWVVSKRSPVLGLVLYILVVICNVQSGVADEYPVRVLAPILILALSAYSKHIRYLNVATAVLATSLVAASDADTSALLLRDLAPLALWGGFALLIAHDLLVRARVVEGIAMLTASAVVVYTFSFAAYELTTTVSHDLRIKSVSSFFNMRLNWVQLSQLTCLPQCQRNFEASLPGVFCTLFGIVSILRDIVGGRANFIKGITSAGIVVALASGVFIAADQQVLLYDPNVTSVITVLALLISERVSAATPSGAMGVDAGSKLIEKKRIGLHTNTYWRTCRSGNTDSRADAEAGELDIKTDKPALGASELPANSGARANGSSKRVHFVTGDAAGDAGDRPLPTAREMEKIWDDVNRYYSDLDKAKKVHRQYQKMAFQQEAVANGVRSYDESSRANAQREREKANEYSQKLREASTRVTNLSRKAKKAMATAQEFEQRIAAAKKSESHAKTS
ncbi:Hypothetical Protein FCC1311_071842 [Hondaea fermentalgiana]|uniref:Uncharacterized protein n=1 Tax=Hondaea fermentalgiana TaxID=2315210 RepID=A0A2R5GQQ9_9STRA|nr:Hypothetical Protein FCC1311_071842 [Hondaea fermentalgiana]|eukprot:GBG30963.1 Hypothetical Protein FCC1311_071842 [Hondaea fermentalgiana]